MKGGRILSAGVKPMKVTTWLQDRLQLRHQRLITRLRPRGSVIGNAHVEMPQAAVAAAPYDRVVTARRL